jgi:acyl dehydratase
MMAAAASTGVVISAAGAGVSALWSGMTLALAVALGAVAFVYVLHELGFVRVPVPGRDWVVPAEWVRDRERIERALGPEMYAYALSGYQWGVYQMLGKLAPIVYVMRRA